MSPPTPETPAGGKRARTRAALIEAALEVVDSKGFVAASLDEIAARAGMTKGAIYSNFGGKADLMMAAARSRSTPFAPNYRPGAPLRAQLRIVAEALVDALPSIQSSARLQAQFQIYLQNEPELRDQIRQELVAGLQALMRLVAERHGSELCVSAEQLVMAVQALSLGFAHQSMQTPELVSDAVILSAFDALAAGATRS